MPQPSNVHINAPLTALSVKYANNAAGFISQKVFPPVPVKKQSDRYWTYGKKQWFRSEAMLRAPGTESVGTGFDLDGTPTYYAGKHAVHSDVDDDLVDNSDSAISLEQDHTELVTNDILLGMEKNWADKFFTTGVWQGSTTGTDIVPAILWDAAGSTPIVDIATQKLSIKRLTGQDVNRLVLGADVWEILKNHPSFLERIKYSQTGIMSEDLLAAVLGLPKGGVLIANAVHDQAQEGAAADHAFVFGKRCLLAHAAPRPGLRTPSAGYTFAWTGMRGANKNGMRVKRFRMEELNSTRIEGEAAYDHKVVGADLGAMFDAVIA